MKRSLFVATLLFTVTTASAQTFRFYAVGGKSVTNRHGQADVRAFALEFERPLTKRTDFGLAIAPYELYQPVSWFGNQFGDGNETVHALSASLSLRHHFRMDSKRMRPYVEIASGPMWAEKRVPASTSRFNFITQGGAGVTFLPERSVAWIVGWRFQHISNGGYAPRNPGLNVNALVLGARVRR